MQPGDVVAERFELLRVAGTGGMGTVWRAQDRVGGDLVALKVLLGAEPEDKLRFAREAELLADLHHPGIVRYLTHGETAAGPFLAMEWIEGETLRQHMRRGVLDPLDVLALGRRLGEALGAVHRRGVIHRDVKPMNILVPQPSEPGALGRAKLLDFGIARRARSEVTETGVLVGTWAYMSPEQASGRSDLDARSDVFQLGAVLYECLTGRAPFRAEAGTAMLAKILLEDPPPVRALRPQVPAPIAAMVERALAKRAADRFADGAELAAEAVAVKEQTEPSRRQRASDAPRAIGEAERRVVCVLLARRPPEDDPTTTGKDQTRAEVREEPIAAAAASRGGKVQFLANGSVLVTFAASGGHTSTDEAARAAACALAIRATAPELALALGTGLSLTTVPVPVGDAIDRAAALLAGVPTGEIGVDAVTAGLIEPRFEVAGARLVTEREAAATRTLLGKPTRCVGRDRELAMLEALFDECAGEPVARVALITGPAGIGKSRVRYELQRRIAQRGLSVETWVARGDPTHAKSPFGLAADALRRAAGIRDGEPLDRRQEKLRARLASAIPDPTTLERALVFLAEMIRAPFPAAAHPLLAPARSDAVAMGDAIRAAWEDWLAAECRLHPVVLVLEDLHWGDLPTVRLVDSALRNLPDTPLLVLALGRPEVQEIFPALWSERDVQTVALAPLTRSAAEKLVRDVLGDAADPATTALLIQRAEGNAFYLEELIRAVAEGSQDALPDTVVGMVQARLAALSPTARRVLRAGSVFGASFWVGGVAKLLGGERERGLVEEELAHLVSIELVTRRAETTFPGEPEHVFRHALVREGAYAMFTGEDRRVGHALAGDWLEANGSTHALALAEHFERGGLAGRASGWWSRAAEEALAANDYLEAIARAQRAVAGDPDGRQRGPMLLLETDAHRCRGALREAFDCGLGAIEAIPPQSLHWLRVVGETIAAAGSLGQLDQVEALLERVRAGGTPTGDEARCAKVVTLCRASTQIWQAGFGERAQDVVREAEDLLATVADAAPLAVGWLEVARGHKGLHHNDLVSHLRHEELALEAFERGGYMRLATMRWNNIGAALCELGELGRAEIALRRSLASGERLGLPGAIAYALQNLTKVLSRRGQLDEARAVAMRSIGLGAKLGNRRIEGVSRAYLAEVLLARGLTDEAEAEARTAVDLLDTIAPSLRIYAMALLIEVLLARGRREDALPYVRWAEDYLAAGGPIEEGEPRIRRALAAAAAAR